MQESEFFPLFECKMSIRWGDMDAFGHVNNAVYFRYMEQARINWLESLGLVEPHSNCGPVIINASMTFLRQLHYPGDVVCRMFAGPMGRSSVETRFELSREDDPGTLVAEGASKIVWVNYGEGKSVPLPDSLRAHLETVGRR